MRVAKVITGALTSVALVFSLIALAVPAAAAVGFDSAYFGESAFLNLNPGQAGQFAVGFTNRGFMGWQRNTSTQVNLAQCCPMNSPSPNASWNDGTWFSNIAYSTHTTDYVGPGQVGWFVYGIKAPAGAAPGSYRFDGDLVIASTGETLHRDGYFQVATVATSNAASITIAPTSVSMQVSTSQQFTATVKDASGNVIGGALVSWSTNGGTVSQSGLYVAPSTPGSFTVTATSGTVSATAQVLVTQTGVLTASFEQPGTYTLVLTFSNTLLDSTVVNTNFVWDSASFPTTPTLQSGGQSNVSKKVRLDFNSSSLPVAGIHALDIFNLQDVDGHTISPNPTSLRVIIPSDGTKPTATSATAVDSRTVDVAYSESMKTSTYYSSTNAIDTTSNYRLVNRDGSPATTGGSSGIGTTITISSVTVGGTSTVDNVFKEKTARLNLSTDLRGGTNYFVLATSVHDEASNVLDPNPTSLQFVFSPDTTRPTVVSAVATQLDLTVNFSKVMKHQATAGAAAASCTGSGAQIDNKSNFTSVDTSNVTTMLGTAISGATKCFIGLDEKSVTFTFDTSQSPRAGSYPLRVSGVQDSFTNLIFPDPTDTTVTITDTTRPTLTSAQFFSTTSFSVTYSEQVRGGSVEPTSAGNAANYSINSGGYGAICSSGSVSISTSDQKTWTITCSGAGVWSASGTRTVTVKDVQDFAGNVLNPNPSTLNF